MTTLNDAIFTAAPNAILVVDRSGVIVNANAQVEALFGWPSWELVGQRVDVLVPGDLRRSHRALMQAYVDSAGDAPRAMGSDRPGIFGLRKDGSRFAAYVTLSKTQLEGTAYVIAMVQDQGEISQSNAQVASLNIALVEALEESRESRRAKEKFLAMISHELRTPLNAILGFADLIRTETLGPIGTRRYLDYLDDIHRSADTLLSHVEDLLTVSKMRSGRYDLDFSRTDAADAVHGAVLLVQADADHRGVSLDFESGDAPSIHSNHRAIQQIALNLLTNAIKLTDRGGSVRITLRHEAAIDSIVLVVEDTGQGIDPKQLEHLGQPFQTTDPDPFVNHATGIGLGLYICGSLSRSLGGTLRLESDVGVGTSATLTLPCASPAERAAESAGTHAVSV